MTRQGQIDRPSLSGFLRFWLSSRTEPLAVTQCKCQPLVSVCPVAESGERDQHVLISDYVFEFPFWSLLFCSQGCACVFAARLLFARSPAPCVFAARLLFARSVSFLVSPLLLSAVLVTFCPRKLSKEYWIV